MKEMTYDVINPHTRIEKESKCRREEKCFGKVSKVPAAEQKMATEYSEGHRRTIARNTIFGNFPIGHTTYIGAHTLGL